MTNPATPGRSRAVVVAVLGTLAVSAYAVFAAAQILALNPLAAVPGRTLAEIQADLAAAGESLQTPLVLVILAIGPVLALAALVVTLRHRRIPVAAVATAYLVLLALGAAGYVAASFGAGMALADTYAVTGEDHAPWAQILFAVSLLAVAGAVALVVRGIRARRSELEV